MGRGNLSEKEIQILLKNPNVREVKGSHVIYTQEFKRHFMKEYQEGKGPTRIFREAGFDVSILGSKRIERAAARWKETNISEFKDRQLKSTARTKEERIYGRLDALEQENALLKKHIQTLYNMFDQQSQPQNVGISKGVGGR